MESGSEPSVAIVMPAYNAAHWLPEVLPAALRAAGADSEVLVVDPGSSDDTASVAESLGARVIRLGHRAGPALARNIGAGEVDADVLLFIDSDCRAAEDVVRRVRDAFAADPTMASLTGSYDDSPPEQNFFSQYMNLRHHFTHQVANREDATFWAGCGAVRRDVFLAVGGFDAERFPTPEIEDVELRFRMGEHGPTRLDPDLQVSHLKHWTLRSVVTTDITKRAMPWAKLIIERGELPNDLNLRLSQRIASLIAPLALLSLVAAPVAALFGQWLAVAASGAILAGSWALNAPMFGFFLHRRGAAFAVGAWLFHQVHLFYAATTMALCFLYHRLAPVREPSEASG